MNAKRVKKLRQQFLKEGKEYNEVQYNIKGEVVEESEWRKFKKEYGKSILQSSQ